MEEGDHARLMELDGDCASLVRRQTRGLLPTGPLIAEPPPREVKGAA